MLSNEKGLTLYELLAALAISGFLITTIFFFTNYTNSNITSITSKEIVMKESRSITDHLISSVRNKFVIASSNQSFILRLDEIKKIKDVNNVTVTVTTGNYVYYTFDETTNTVSFISHNEGQNINHTLSNHVLDLNILQTESNKRISIELIMQLPNNQTFTTSTVIYTPQL